MTGSGNYPTVFLLNANDSAGDCERILSSSGYRVETLDDGGAELDVVMQSRPEAVIVDLKHPCAECLRLIQQIRRGDQRIAIIVIAASPSVRNAVDALKAGADEILREPFSPDELKLVVAVALKQRREGSCQRST